MDVHLEERDGITLCALCKTSLAFEPTRTCADCKLTVHVTCAVELGSNTCATPGCAGSPVPVEITSKGEGSPVGTTIAPQPGFPRPQLPSRYRKLMWVGALALAGVGAAFASNAPEQMLLHDIRTGNVEEGDVPALVDALGSMDPDLWVPARNALTRFDANIAKPLLDEVPGSNVFARSRMPAVLHALGTEAIAPCIAALSQPQTTRQVVAARSLARFGPAAGSGSTPLQTALGKTQSEAMRIACVEALGKIGGPGAAHSVARHLHGSRRLRAAALTALRSMGKEAAPALEDVQPFLNDPSEALSQAAEQILENVGDLAAIEDALVARLETAERDETAKILTQRGRRGVLVLARGLLSQNPDTRLVVSQMLAKPSVDASPAAQAIGVAVRSERDPTIRRNLLRSLGRPPD